MPMTRPKPRQVSQAPSGELNENSAGVGSRVVDVAVGAVQVGGEAPDAGSPRERLSAAGSSVAAHARSRGPGRRAAPPRAPRSRARARRCRGAAGPATTSSTRRRCARGCACSPARSSSCAHFGSRRNSSAPSTGKVTTRRGSPAACGARGELARRSSPGVSRAHRLRRSRGSRAARRARTAASGGRSARSSCRRSSARCAPGWSGRWRSPAGCPRCGRPAACPCGRGTAARRARRSRRSGAGPRRRACRTRARTCPSPDTPVTTISSFERQRRASRFLRLFWRAPRMTMLSDMRAGARGRRVSAAANDARRPPGSSETSLG